MKKILTLALLLATATSLTPAHSRTLATKRITFRADVPCGQLCAYNLDQRSNEEFVDEESGGALRGTPAQGATGNTPSACSAPFPAGSFADFVVTAPRGAKQIVFKSFPETDWDTFICSKPASGNNGKILATGANSVIEWNDTVPESNCQVGCVETARARAVPGRKYVLRAYNYSDVAPLPAQYYFIG